MAENGKKDREWLSWALIVLLFSVGLSPLALILLFLKLFAGDRWEKMTTARKKSDRARAAVGKLTKTPGMKRSNAALLKGAGVCLAAVGLFSIGEPISALFWSSDWVGLWLEDLLSAVTCLLGGGALVWSGVSMDRALKRYAKYLSVMGDRDAVAVAELAGTLGYSGRRVRRDLQRMIDRGYFGGQAYLNVELDHLFRSGQACEDLKQRRQAEAVRQETESTAYGIVLQRIRQANDRIADPELSAQIDRLETITARIFRVVEEKPEKQPQIDTFLHYYLPTTQKLLDSYAEFEAAGVEGENLRQAKQRIEDTMDAIIRGFEHQLDRLYQADAMDVDSDIRVMETMLRRDTASASEDFGLGGAAVQTREES